MTRKLVYGPRDTLVRLWVDGEYFYSKVPRKAAEMAMKSHEFHHDADDFTALCYLAHIATNHRDNPRGKGSMINAEELGVEIVARRVDEEPTPEPNPNEGDENEEEMNKKEEEPAKEYKQLTFF